MAKFVEFDGELINIELITDIRFLSNEQENKRTKKIEIVDYEVEFSFTDGDSTTFEEITQEQINDFKKLLIDANLMVKNEN